MFDEERPRAVLFRSADLVLLIEEHVHPVARGQLDGIGAGRAEVDRADLEQARFDSGPPRRIVGAQRGRYLRELRNDVTLLRRIGGEIVHLPRAGLLGGEVLAEEFPIAPLHGHLAAVLGENPDHRFRPRRRLARGERGPEALAVESGRGL